MSGKHHCIQQFLALREISQPSRRIRDGKVTIMAAVHLNDTTIQDLERLEKLVYSMGSLNESHHAAALEGGHR